MDPNTQKNDAVTRFLDDLQHPLRNEIEQIRDIILNADEDLSENIKWNGPNYTFRGEDRITMKIQPPTKLQLIFHRGAKKQEAPDKKLIEAPWLDWKGTDRAVATFLNMEMIEKKNNAIKEVVRMWIRASEM